MVELYMSSVANSGWRHPESGHRASLLPPLMLSPRPPREPYTALFPHPSVMASVVFLFFFSRFLLLSLASAREGHDFSSLPLAHPLTPVQLRMEAITGFLPYP